MNRTARILAFSLALLLVGVASAIAAPSDRAQERRAPVAASHQPESPDDVEGADEADDGDGPSELLLDRLVERLGEADVETTAEEIAGLVDGHGVGGAVRILAWAAAAGMDASEIADMFDSGLGWGEIARQLNEADEELDLHPGIGNIMGGGGGSGAGNGLGRANAPGQLKQQP